MINFEKIYKKLAKKYFKNHIDNQKVFPAKMKKYMRTYAFKIVPKIMQIGSFMAIVWSFNYISNKYGFERVIIIGIVAILFSLGNLKDDED